MLAAGPPQGSPPAPLQYRSRRWRGTHLLAYDESGDGRIVEALGDVAAAEHIAVLVPGNDNYLWNYFDPGRPTRPRVNGMTVLRTMRELDPRGRCAVVVWLGYRPPNGFAEAVWRRPAVHGAGDLARLTHVLPAWAHITLVGHSYGAVVCGLALARSRAQDCVVLGSPGMGGGSAAELGFAGRLWAGLGERDWIRFFPRGRLGGAGHGPSPLRAGFGAVRFETGPIPGHCSYYAQGSESVRNIARIGLGRYEEVSLSGGRSSWPGPVREAA